MSASRSKAACWRVALALAASLAAGTAGAGVFSVASPWLRIAPDGRTAEAFMELASSDDAALIEVRMPLASGAALLAPGERNVPIPSLALRAGAPLKLEPGGYRIAVTALSRKLKPGERVPLTLVVADSEGARQEIPVNAEVRQQPPTAERAPAAKKGDAKSRKAANAGSRRPSQAEVRARR